MGNKSQSSSRLCCGRTELPLSMLLRKTAFLSTLAQSTLPCRMLRSLLGSQSTMPGPLAPDTGTPRACHSKAIKTPEVIQLTDSRPKHYLFEATKSLTCPGDSAIVSLREWTEGYSFILFFATSTRHSDLSLSRIFVCFWNAKTTETRREFNEALWHEPRTRISSRERQR